MMLSATQREVSLLNDSTISGGWTIERGDSVTLRLNGNKLTFSGTSNYGDFGLKVRGRLAVVGLGRDTITHSRAIQQLVRVEGGELDIDGGVWDVWSAKNGLLVVDSGAVTIRSGVFFPLGELIRASRDTMAIVGGEFHSGIPTFQSVWMAIEPSMRLGLRGGVYEWDPRDYGLDADYGYEVFACTGARPSYRNYYIGPAHTDTTVLDTAGYCWGDTLWHGGQMITEPGTYYDTLSNYRGGDSVVVLPVQWNCAQTFYVYSYDTIRACDSIYLDDEWYYTSTCYRSDTFNLAPWRDSIAVKVVLLQNSTIRHRTVSTCDSYIWRGRELTESGEYYDTLKTALCGCDSIYHLSLTLGHSTRTYRDTVHMCVGQSYTWQGKTYTRAGVYSAVLQTAFPCDSFVELHLMIDALEQDSVLAYSLHGHRMLVLDHAALTEQGYRFATDSVVWYRVVGEMDDLRYPAETDDQVVGIGDFYTGDGQPLRGDYYALIRTENPNECRLPLRTVVLHAPAAAAAPAVSLSPAMVTSGTPICICGLDINRDYTIRIMSPSGLLLRAVSVHGADSYVFDALGNTGCYFVSVQSDTENVSLRYIVQ